MTEITGRIKKLIGEINEPINYSLPIGEEKIHLNEFLGKEITLKYLQEIICIQCDRKTNKSFQQGYLLSVLSQAHGLQSLHDPSREM